MLLLEAIESTIKGLLEQVRVGDYVTPIFLLLAVYFIPIIWGLYQRFYLLKKIEGLHIKIEQALEARIENIEERHQFELQKIRQDRDAEVKRISEERKAEIERLMKQIKIFEKLHKQVPNPIKDTGV